jgi:hypothetical protein
MTTLLIRFLCMLLEVQGYYSQTQSSRDSSAEVFTSSSSSTAAGDGTTGAAATASASSTARKVHTVTPGNGLVQLLALTFTVVQNFVLAQISSLLVQTR